MIHLVPWTGPTISFKTRAPSTRPGLVLTWLSSPKPPPPGSVAATGAERTHRLMGESKKESFLTHTSLFLIKSSPSGGPSNVCSSLAGQSAVPRPWVTEGQ